MQIQGSTVLVTGGNRGLGAELVTALRGAGCARIYLGARHIDGLNAPAGTELVQLDITNAAQVAAAAARCADTTILINNAGVAAFTPLLGVPTTDNARNEMDINYFGTLAMCRAFAPVLGRNGGGALVNVLSVASWISTPMQGSYCASKAAAWSLTNAARFELRAQGTFVAGVYAGYIDTDMTANVAFPKASARDVAARILSGIEAGREEILADERAVTFRAELLGDYSSYNANMQKVWDHHVQQQANTKPAAN